ncbi:MAG: metallophosphoesterase [Verrucomicrobiae bacterium]|nr:metallophosphoesterase [Verrucomicrobiae bacterium]
MNFSFIQITDIHVGTSLDFPGMTRKAEENLKDAVEEINRLRFKPAFVAATGDCANSGMGDVLKYRKLVRGLRVPVHSIPSSHDLALGSLPGGGIVLSDDVSRWKKWIGPARFSFSHGGVFFVFFEPFRKISEKGGGNIFDGAVRDWLAEELDKAGRKTPVIILYHIPLMPAKNGYVGWRKADDFLSALKGRNIMALICGHRHRNEEHRLADGVTQIQTGPLAGVQWTGMPPNYFFPVRGGYRICVVCDGKFNSFYKQLGSDLQVNIEKIGGAHTQGPRPQVKPAIVARDARLLVKAYSGTSSVTGVDYSLGDGKWHSMRKKSENIFSEWEAVLPAKRAARGHEVLMARVTARKGNCAYDFAPVFFKPDAKAPVAARNAPEMVFEVFTMKAEEGAVDPKTKGFFPWRCVEE